MKKVLTTPLRDEDLADLKIGDVVYLTGRLVTCRDVAHRRLIEQGRQLPVNLEGGAIFHAGPIVRFSPFKWSINTLPFKWSISCWRIIAKYPFAVSDTGRPFSFKYLTLICSARSTSISSPGKDRQPSWLGTLPLEDEISGLIRT